VVLKLDNPNSMMTQFDSNISSYSSQVLKNGKALVMAEVIGSIR